MGMENMLQSLEIVIARAEVRPVAATEDKSLVVLPLAANIEVATLGDSVLLKLMRIEAAALDESVLAKPKRIVAATEGESVLSNPVIIDAATLGD